jgi:hypothetical protein
MVPVLLITVGVTLVAVIEVVREINIHVSSIDRRVKRRRNKWKLSH